MGKIPYWGCQRVSCTKLHTAEGLRRLLDGITGDPTTEGPPRIPHDAVDVLRDAIRDLTVCHSCAQCLMQARLDADPDSCWAKVPDPSTGEWRRCRLERSFHDGSRPERLDHSFVEADLTRQDVDGWLPPVVSA